MRVFRGIGAGLGVLLAAIVTATLITVVRGVNGGEATHSQTTIDLVAVDPNIAGNTATSLGSQDICLEVAAGATVEVDVTVSAIPSDRPLTAFQFDLLYDLNIVNVTAANVGMLLAANEGSNALPALSDSVPDSDGAFQSAALDLSTSVGETGPGVLSRIELKAVGTGVTVLSPNQNEVLVLDDYNEEIPVNALAASYLAVGVPCPRGSDGPLRDAQVKRLATPHSVRLASGVPDTSGPATVVVHQGSNHPNNVGIYLAFLPPLGSSNFAGCSPAGVVNLGSANLLPGETATIKLDPPWQCADPGAVDGATWTLKAIADVNADDFASCATLNQVFSGVCSAALADDDDDDANNTRLRARPIVDFRP